MQCPICLDELLDTDGRATTPCGHQLHATCIAEWILTHPVSPSCPMCRAPTADEWCGALVGEAELADARAANVSDDDGEEAEVQVDMVCSRCNVLSNEYRECGGVCGHIICTDCWTAQEHFHAEVASQWMHRLEADYDTCLRCWMDALLALQASE